MLALSFLVLLHMSVDVRASATIGTRSGIDFNVVESEGEVEVNLVGKEGRDEVDPPFRMIENTRHRIDPDSRDTRKHEGSVDGHFRQKRSHLLFHSCQHLKKKSRN